MSRDIHTIVHPDCVKFIRRRDSVSLTVCPLMDPDVKIASKLAFQRHSIPFLGDLNAIDGAIRVQKRYIIAPSQDQHVGGMAVSSRRGYLLRVGRESTRMIRLGREWHFPEFDFTVTYDHTRVPGMSLLDISASDGRFFQIPQAYSEDQIEVLQAVFSLFEPSTIRDMPPLEATLPMPFGWTYGVCRDGGQYLYRSDGKVLWLGWEHNNGGGGGSEGLFERQEEYA